MIRLCRRVLIVSAAASKWSQAFGERGNAAISPSRCALAEIKRSGAALVCPPPICSRRNVGRGSLSAGFIIVPPREGQGPLIDDTALLAGRACNRFNGLLEG
jgi:hypothetical protein